MQIIEDDSIDLKTRYNQYRIMELEKLILTETSLDTINEYKNRKKYILTYGKKAI